MQGTEMVFEIDHFRSQDVLLCTAFGLSGNTNVGRKTKRWKPIPIRWLFLHGGLDGPIHDWKAGSTGSDRHRSRGRSHDDGHGYLHGCEDHGVRSAFLPASGSEPAILGHDQHLSRQTNFQISHAGKGISNNWTRSGVAWVRLNFLQVRLWLDICGRSPSDVKP